MKPAFEKAAARLAGVLKEHAENRDRRPAARAALAKLRQSLQNPVYAAPCVAPCAEGLDGWGEELMYLVAGLFALNPNHQEGVSFAAAFRSIPDKSDSTERRFQMLLAARREQLPDLLRHGVKLLASKGVGLDWKLLMFDLYNWDSPYNTVQKKWAKDFYRSQTAGNLGEKNTEGEVSA